MSSTDTQLMRRAQIEREVEAGKHDAAYWDFVVDVGAGEIALHEDAIMDAIEQGRYFDTFCDYLEGETA